MYGVLYAVSPELFPTRDRGTGNANVASANRVFGIMVSGLANQEPSGARYAKWKLTWLCYVVGSDHCVVRQLEYACADLGGWCDIPHSRVHCTIATI